jgi:hypothetical protein
MNAGRFMCVAMLFLSGAGVVRASDSHLSPAEVSSLADTAASRAGYDVKLFSAVPPFFDPVSQSWSRDYSKWSESGVKAFTVLVYDKSSRTEVSCIGMRSGAKPIDEREIPAEIKPFIASGKTAVQFDCVDLNGDGRPDYLLILHTEPLHQLMILVRQPDGTLSLQGTNKDVIWDEYGVGVNGGYSVSSRRKWIHGGQLEWGGRSWRRGQVRLQLFTGAEDMGIAANCEDRANRGAGGRYREAGYFNEKGFWTNQI